MFATHGSGGSCVAAHRQGEPARAEPVTPHVAQFFLPTVTVYAKPPGQPASRLTTTTERSWQQLRRRRRVFAGASLESIQPGCGGGGGGLLLVQQESSALRSGLYSPLVRRVGPTARHSPVPGETDAPTSGRRTLESGPGETSGASVAAAVRAMSRVGRRRCLVRRRGAGRVGRPARSRTRRSPPMAAWELSGSFSLLTGPSTKGGTTARRRTRT
jgi:hypothetical protein